jgi:hypothetical protein
VTTSMKGFRCWTTQSVRDTVFSDIGALPTDTDALFMAAHTAMELEHSHGTELPSEDSGERQVLNALLASFGDSHRNTLIAITGSSGAGKSHVVRWVHANLPSSDSGFHVLYVPRAVQTIRELLKRIVEGLPGEGGAEIMERVDSAVSNITPVQLQDHLLEGIREALTWTLEPSPPRDGESASEAEAREARTNLLGHADEQGKRRNGLADLLALSQVNATLLRSGGLLERFVESVYRETSSRDDQQDGFTNQDLPLRDREVLRALAHNPDLLGLWKVVLTQPKPALRLLDEALRSAAPQKLGFRSGNGETLDSLFRRSRQLLRERNKELVLLFEDLVQFGLIDGELYDQFTTQPGADMAPLRVVFAVTDGPYDKLGETVRTRITHRFEVKSASLADRGEFVARYLNLVRVGRDDVEAAWQEATDGQTDWMRNACDTREEGNPCRFRDRCHAGFGTVEVPRLGQVGLYPYNEVALQRGLARRGENPTARDILDVCVTEQLVEADAHIAAGTYPHDRLRDRFDFAVRRTKEVVLDGRTGEQADRLYRALVLWGDEEQVTPEVAEAFSLQVSTRTSGSSSTSPVGRSAAPSEPRLTPKKQATDTARLPEPLAPLLQWQNSTEKLPDRDANEYRSILHKMVSARLELDQDLFHAGGSGAAATVLKGLFPGHSFVIDDSRGRKPAAANVRFDLTRSPEDVRVLIAAKWFSDHGHWEPENGRWRWPEGYEPAVLMLALEHRLDQWAGEVRERYVRAVGGRNVARVAIGVRAVVLLALGTSPEKLRTVNDVLQAKPRTVEDVDVWAAVNNVAREVLVSIPTVELVTQFSAVRQSDRGGPQLLDAIGLEIDLKAVLAKPFEYLRHVESDMAEAGAMVAAGARKLAAAVDKAAAGYLPEISKAVDYLGTELDGCTPKAVAAAARRVGELAVEHQLFRPVNAVTEFREATDALRDLPVSLPLDWREDDAVAASDQVLAAHWWASKAIRGQRALAQIRHAVHATRAECVRNDVTADDLQELSNAVRANLRAVRVQLNMLSLSEASDG